ncbi:MAG: hypothetical protein ACU836_19025, partial [Gammaproteobacteria bacterium]
VAMAEDAFLETLLRFTGISVSPTQTRGNDHDYEGDIWLAELGDGRVLTSRQITRGKYYRTPIWIPGGTSFVTMKGSELVRIDSESDVETPWHGLTLNTALIGFAKDDSNTMLIRKDTVVEILSLASSQVAVAEVPYDQNNQKDRDALDRLISQTREYSFGKIFVDDSRERSGRGYKTLNTIRIETANGETILVRCDSICGQPALSEDGRRLLYVVPVDED